MTQDLDQILTVAEVRAAEQALIDAGVSVDDLMQRAGTAAAEWVWRIAGRHPVTVLCGPGNNGGDGYVIAEALREKGADVTVLAAAAPATEAARAARALYQGDLREQGDGLRGEVLVDCLFGSGLSRPLTGDHAALLVELAARHRVLVAIDLPSGLDADSGAPLNPALPHADLTLALGAWKFAHFLMPAQAACGETRLVDIGLAGVDGAARAITRPQIAAPAPDAHKYRRGLLAVVGGAMPGAAVLACRSAQGAGAGYVKLFADGAAHADLPADVVVAPGKLSDVLTDDRNAAILVGPGLGRDGKARERLATALADPVAAVIDADALVLLGERQLAERAAPTIATPHEGELAALEAAFGCDGAGDKARRARALAAASGMTIVAKGPDTVVASPDGRLALAPRASSWLSAAGTGDVLAGIIASRLAVGVEAFDAACQGVWLQADAARLAGPAFSAGQVAWHVRQATAACL